MTTQNRNLRETCAHTLLWLGLAAAACGDNIVPEFLQILEDYVERTYSVTAEPVSV